MKKRWCLLILLAFLTGCVENSGGAKKRVTDTDIQDGGSTGDNGSGNGAGPDDSSFSDASSDIVNSIRVDLRHIIDPYDGTYKTKVTIPQNYKGLLYFSGLNVTSLKSNFVYIRLRFGRSKTEYLIPATTGTAPGITPQTDVDLLIVDMENQPLKDLRLFYKLFDYNDYDSNDNGVEFESTDSPNVPVSDVKDSGLYCRGLNLEDDPTFNMSTTNSQCDQAGETCLYTFANIGDSGLYDNGATTLLTPKKEQVDDVGSGYTSLGQANYINHCLPDINLRSSIELGLQTTLSSTSALVAAYGDTAYAGAYVYNGPYRRFDPSAWQISGDAIFSNMSVAGTQPTGLFQFVLPNAPVDTVADPSARAEGGLKSFLYPRAAKNNYSEGTQYFGYTDLTNPFGDRNILTLLSGGETEYVDGCNIRVTRPNVNTCNVTATIDIVTRDTETGTFNTIATSNRIKLQISEPSSSDQFGREVLYTAVKTCENSSSCGSNECCYNNRCWSRDIVSQCREDVSPVGNLLTGATCNADTECASLCCGSNRTCSEHNPNDTNGTSCNKVPGQRCITKEFCQEKFVNQCQIVKTGGLDANGNPDCRLNCYRVAVKGDCVDGVCREPEQPTPPAFDPSDPNRCATAINPPSGFD